MPARELPAHLLEQTAPRAARLVALHLLHAAASARERLGDTGDEESLHDFRVAVRRLRSWLRAVEPCLGEGLPRKLTRRLRRVARGTSGARDAQVHLAWLRAQKELRRGGRAAGARWLVERLERDLAGGEARAVEEAAQAFDRLRAPMAAALESYTVTCRVDAPPTPTLAAALAPIVREHLRALHDRLTDVHSMDEGAAIHQARIAGKRLRYLLEPVADRVEGAPEVIEQLRSLQAMLGDVHDSHVFAAQVSAAAAEAGAEHARREADAVLEGARDDAGLARRLRALEPQPGLLAVARLVRAHGEERFAELASAWLDGAEERPLAAADAVAGRLEGGGPGTEIERKFLLRSLPDAARAAPPLRIAQGYLPGVELVERVRRVTEADGSSRFWRTVKLGTGIARLEVEEETTPAVFKGLWALTRGRRVAKRRYVVAEGALRWELDEFEGRDLVLAEVELESAEAEVAIPAWLAPHLVREVTGEDEYVNANLAR